MELIRTTIFLLPDENCIPHIESTQPSCAPSTAQFSDAMNETFDTIIEGNVISQRIPTGTRNMSMNVKL